MSKTLSTIMDAWILARGGEVELTAKGVVMVHDERDNTDYEAASEPLDTLEKRLKEAATEAKNPGPT
ncbi:MAG TPA: hypothetical protein VGK74_02465 [Symbiobacteriaceae bacterium]|jgi:hypothetical protein